MLRALCFISPSAPAGFSPLLCPLGTPVNLSRPSSIICLQPSVIVPQLYQAEPLPLYIYVAPHHQTPSTLPPWQQLPSPSILWPLSPRSTRPSRVCQAHRLRRSISDTAGQARSSPASSISTTWVSTVLQVDETRSYSADTVTEKEGKEIEIAIETQRLGW